LRGGARSEAAGEVTSKAKLITAKNKGEKANRDSERTKIGEHREGRNMSMRKSPNILTREKANCGKDGISCGIMSRKRMRRRGQRFDKKVSGCDRLRSF